MERAWAKIRPKLAVFFVLVLISCLPPLFHPVSTATRGSSLMAPASSAGVVGANVPVVGEAAPDRQQVETTIVVDPRNPNVLVAGAQDYRLKSIGEHRWHGYYRSVDGGQTWTSGLLPGFPGDASSQGLASPLHRSNATSDPVLAFDRLGNVYYAGLVVNVSAAGFLGNGPIGNTVAFVAKYTNDGVTYSSVKLVTGPLFAVNPASWVTSGSSIGASFRAFTIPQIAADAHGVYVVFDDVRLGNSNVYITRSTDGGGSWTAPLRINDITTGQHFFPTIVASGGIVDVAWYDSRFNTQTPMTALDVFFTNSNDGGVSFSARVRVTNVSFNPGLVKRTDAPNWNEPFMGDYIGIAAKPSAAHPFWADNRFACDTYDAAYTSCVDQDAFTATILLPDFGIAVAPSIQTILQGASGNAKVTLSSLNGFQGNVTVSASSSPSGLPISPSSKTLQLSAGGTSSFNLTFSPTTSTMPVSYTVNITGTSGPISHFVLTAVQVQSSSVGGSLVNLDRLKLLMELLSLWVPILLLGTATIAAWAWRKRARGDSSSSYLQPPKTLDGH